jgi:hypothetical protein
MDKGKPKPSRQRVKEPTAGVVAMPGVKRLSRQSGRCGTTSIGCFVVVARDSAAPVTKGAIRAALDGDAPPNIADSELFRQFALCVGARGGAVNGTKRSLAPGGTRVPHVIGLGLRE